jgi:trypsin
MGRASLLVRSFAVLVVSASAALGGAEACTSERGDANGSGRRSSPFISGVTTPDSNFSGVVALNFSDHSCSGLLIAPDIVLTAAHCVYAASTGCQNQAYYSGALVSVTTNGVTPGTGGGDIPAGFTNYTIDGVVVQPLASNGVNYTSCALGTKVNCAACTDAAALECAYNFTTVDGGPGDGNLGLTDDQLFDIAMVHIWPNYSGTAYLDPDFTAYPRLQVVTSFTDTNSTPYTIHANIPDTSWTSDTTFTIVGFGTNTADLGQTRFAGPAIIPPLTSSTETYFESLLEEAGGTPIGCNGKPSGTSFQGLMATTSRTGPKFSGPTSLPGDSGSPLLVHGGTFGGQGIPALPNQWVSIGVDSRGGCALDAGKVAPGNCEESYVPTAFNKNGAWIDQHASDFDGDGTPDWADNCPTVPNDQYDSNFDDELAVANADYPDMYQGTPTRCDPTVTTGPNPYPSCWSYVLWWRTNFLGDACDPNPTTRGRPAYNFVPEPPIMGPCDDITVIDPDGGTTITTDASAGPCPMVATSGLHFESFIGLPMGSAPSAPGKSIPAFCPCSAATAQLCSSPTFNCPVANDPALPYTSPANPWSPTVASSWVAMASQAVAPPYSDSIFQPFATTHQQPTRYVSQPTYAFNWDFLYGLSPGTTSQSGILWTNVVFNEFVPAPTGCQNVGGVTLCEFPTTEYTYGGTITTLSDHYEPISVQLQNGLNIVTIPSNYNPFFPWWLEGEYPTYDPGDPAQYTIIGVDPGGDLQVIVATGAGDIEPVLASLFTSAASSLLVTVGTGASEFIFADDLVAGDIWRTGPRTGLVLETGTTTIVGAVSYLGSQIDGQAVTSPPIASAPASLRAFSSNNDTLYSLAAGSTPGSFALSTLPVAQFFGPPGGPTAGDPTNLDFGEAVEPLAMTWNAAAQSLYVLVSFQATVSKHWHSSTTATVYQLDRVDGAGDVISLWTSAPIETSVPPPTNFWLSSGSLGEVVLAVSNGGGAEFTILDEIGMPVQSYSTDDATWKAPVIVNNAGATVAMVTREHHLPPPHPHHHHIPYHHPGKEEFEASLVPASEWTAGVCGARWLRSIAAGGSSSDLLAINASMCGP